MSVRQPWAWLIISGIKDIENRNRPTKFKGRIYIHASQTIDVENTAIGNTEQWILNRLTTEEKKRYFSEPKVRGAIIGEVDIVNCVTETTSPWFIGKYGFVLANPVAYKKPIPCRGALGFFEPKFTSNDRTER